MWLVRLTQRQVGGLAAEQGMLRFFFARAKGQLTLVGTQRGDVREAEIIWPRIRSCTFSPVPEKQPGGSSVSLQS